MAAPLAAIALTSGVAEARDTAEPQIDIPAATLPEAIAELSRETGVSIGTEGRLPRLRTPAVHGRMSVGEALERLLAGTGYAARRAGPTAWQIAPSPAGQSTAPSPPQALAETFGAPIIVTGAKRELPLLDLPMALSVVRFPDHRRFDPGTATASIAGETEGLALTALGPGRNRMFLRGVADSAFNGESQSTVAVVLDDARLTYAAPDPDIRLVDVEQIELLKGPQGSLYGMGALGGIYHIVSHAPDLDKTSLAASSGAEMVAGGEAGFSGSAVANLPLASGRAALRLVGYSAKEAGWVDTGTRQDSNSGRVLGTRARLGVDAGDGWRIDLTGFAQWLESRDSQYVYRQGARSRPAQLPEPHDNDLRHLSLRLGKRSGGLDFVLSSAMTWHEVGDTLDATVGADSFGLANPQLLEDARKYRVWDSEARLSGSAGRLEWLAGLSHIEARQADLWTLTSDTPATLTVDDDHRTTADSAAFGEVTLPVLDRVKLSLGARLFHSNVRETLILPSGPATHEDSRSGMTPSLALSWRPRAGRLLYLRYGSAFRHGGIDIAPSGAVETLKSDDLATIEAGWREEWASGTRLDLGTWYSWWEHLQSDMLQDNGLIETQNAGNATIVGIEASLDQPLAPGWNLQAGGTFTMAKLVRNMLGYELTDRHLPAVPEYTLRAALEHHFPIGSADASLRLQLRYLGPSHLSFDPALDRPMGKVLESRLEARAALGGFDFALAADNLFNRHADVFAFGNSLRFATLRQYTPQQPLTVSASILKRF